MGKPSPLLSGNWQSVVAIISSVVDLEASARQFGALRRRRKIRTAEALLRLALIWGPGRQSLREAAALAADAGIADLSDKAVEGRLRKLGDWLEHILAALLAHRLDRDSAPAVGEIALSLVDGSVICSPGSGDDWRLHARYDPALGRFTDLVLTPSRQAETASRTRIGAGRVMVMDRGYARVRSLQAVLGEGSDFITRIGWRSLVLHDANGQRIDLMSLLTEGASPSEHPVWVKGIDRGLRLVIQPLPPDIAERQRTRRARKASKKSHTLDARTAKAAGFMMLLTSLSQETSSTEQVIISYRDRWQVEIGFKRLKTLGRLDELPSADPVLARTWLLAHLIAAVLTDDLANEIVGFPPSAH
ncbi:MAG TPA: IS4 family transposase [Rhodopila sp.]|jgi:hypothetical protein